MIHVHIVGVKGNTTRYVCVAITEVQESIEILEGMGYTIIRKEIQFRERFKRMNTQCLTTLRNMTKKT